MSMPEDRVTSASELPDVPFFVTATDTFMSGWGPAENLTNRLVFACATEDEAVRVANTLRQRRCMRNVRVCETKPRLRPTGYLYQLKTRASAPLWYV